MTLIDTDDLVEELEHEIITIDGITMLIPTLLASDVAFSIYGYTDEGDTISYNHIAERCALKLNKIFSEMKNHTKELLEENGRKISYDKR